MSKSLLPMKPQNHLLFVFVQVRFSQHYSKKGHGESWVMPCGLRQDVDCVLLASEYMTQLTFILRRFLNRHRNTRSQ